MLVLDIIAIVIIVAVFYSGNGNLRYRPTDVKPIQWILLAIAVILIVISGIISGAAM